MKHPPGYPVTYTNPTTHERVTGKIIDEVWAIEPERFGPIAEPNDGWREAAFVAQLIKWPHRYKSVRLTYYLRKEGEGEDAWYFGGQYAADMGVKDFRTLLEKLQAKSW